MYTFEGFSKGKTHFTPVPAQFFSDILPNISDTAELKLILYLFWRLDRTDGNFRYVSVEEIMEDDQFLNGISPSTNKAKEQLSYAITNAVHHRIILSADIKFDESHQTIIFMNTPKGRAAIDAIRTGKWKIGSDDRFPIELGPDKLNIFVLYEENIGPLSPMISEALKDAESSYPIEWVSDAFQIAVEKNIRNWRYISAILEGWHKKGKYERKDRRDTEEARKKYSDWET